MTERSHKAILKIIAHCEKAVAYTSGMTRDAFTDNGMVMEAVVFNLSQIGELAKHVDGDVKTANPHINWGAMRGLRNRIIHDYDNIKAGVIWNTVQNDLPVLSKDLKHLAQSK